MTSDIAVPVAENLARVQERMAAAAHRAGRSVDDIILIAVSKTQPIAAIRAVYLAGQRVFGENRIEELAEKAPQLPPDIAWHMIGHVQSRKAKWVVQSRCALVHSVDSVKLARRLSRFAGEEGLTLPVLVEVNVAREATKEGFLPEAVEGALGEILSFPHLQVLGLMTMAPIVADPEDARPVFRRLRQMRDDLARRYPHADWQHLSMGMTDDFEVAIEEGATMVRVGRAIFGERQV